MATFDSDAEKRVSDFVTVPAGAYRVRIADVRPGTTRAGAERWSVRLTVADGPHVDKQAAWDSIVFTPRARARARQVLLALGLPAKGRVAIEPMDLLGREAIVEIRPAEYQSVDGSTVRRNEVPYDGWRAVGPACGHSVCSQHFIDTGDIACVATQGGGS